MHFMAGQAVTFTKDLSDQIPVGTQGTITAIKNDGSLEIDVPGWARTVTAFPDEIKHQLGGR